MNWIRKLFEIFKENQKPVFVEEIIVMSAKMLHKSIREIISLNPKISEEAALKRIMQAYNEWH